MRVNSLLISLCLDTYTQQHHLSKTLKICKQQQTQLSKSFWNGKLLERSTAWNASTPHLMEKEEEGTTPVSLSCIQEEGSVQSWFAE